MLLREAGRVGPAVTCRTVTERVFIMLMAGRTVSTSGCCHPVNSARRVRRPACPPAYVSATAGWGTTDVMAEPFLVRDPTTATGSRPTEALPEFGAPQSRALLPPRTQGSTLRGGTW